VPLVVGGIISAEDENVLRNMGVAAVYTPKDYALDAIMADIVRVVGRAWPREESGDAPSRRKRAAAG
jgi:(2R)-ethylmalonyl-CoA mutase